MPSLCPLTLLTACLRPLSTIKLKVWLESLNYKLRYSFIHFISSVNTKHLRVGTLSDTEDKSVMKKKCRCSAHFCTFFAISLLGKVRGHLAAAAPLKPQLPGRLLGAGPAEVKSCSLGRARRSMRKGRLPSAGISWHCRAEWP